MYRIGRFNEIIPSKCATNLKGLRRRCNDTKYPNPLLLKEPFYFFTPYIPQLDGENEPNPELDPEPDPEFQQNSEPKPEQTLKPLIKTIPP